MESQKGHLIVFSVYHKNTGPAQADSTPLSPGSSTRHFPFGRRLFVARAINRRAPTVCEQLFKIHQAILDSRPVDAFCIANQTDFVLAPAGPGEL